MTLRRFFTRAGDALVTALLLLIGAMFATMLIVLFLVGANNVMGGR